MPAKDRDPDEVIEVKLFSHEAENDEVLIHWAYALRLPRQQALEVMRVFFTGVSTSVNEDTLRALSATERAHVTGKKTMPRRQARSVRRRPPRTRGSASHR